MSRLVCLGPRNQKIYGQLTWLKHESFVLSGSHLHRAVWVSHSCLGLALSGSHLHREKPAGVPPTPTRCVCTRACCVRARVRVSPAPRLCASLTHSHIDTEHTLTHAGCVRAFHLHLDFLEVLQHLISAEGDVTSEGAREGGDE